MKQTAVEWLVENLNLDETSPNYNKLTIEKAKAMEEEQIKKAFHFLLNKLEEWKKSKNTTTKY